MRTWTARAATAAWVERLFLVSVALLPLVCWPGLDRPFSIPKLWLIGALDLLVAVEYLLRKPASLPMPAWPWSAWLAAISLSALTGPYVSLEALLLMVLPAGICGADIESRPPASPPTQDRVRDSARTVATWISIGSAIEAAIALAQYLGHDPFQSFGWRPESFASPRMRVYGTLGNPDFVAAWLCTTLPLGAAARGAVRAALVALLLGGIFATQSRIFLLALPAAGVVLALRGRRVARWWWLAGLPVAMALLWVSSARPLGVTVQGRLYLAKVTAAHLVEVPVAGYGPGSFGLKFSEWQVGWLREHPEDAEFAGPVDHAHNDYLEFWVEYGPLGFGAFLVLCGWLLARAWRACGHTGALAALAALLVIACADFPLHRPAEWTLFWILISFLLPPNKSLGPA